MISRDTRNEKKLKAVRRAEFAQNVRDAEREQAGVDRCLIAGPDRDTAIDVDAVAAVGIARHDGFGLGPDPVAGGCGDDRNGAIRVDDRLRERIRDRDRRGERIGGDGRGDDEAHDVPAGGPQDELRPVTAAREDRQAHGADQHVEGQGERRAAEAQGAADEEDREGLAGPRPAFDDCAAIQRRRFVGDFEADHDAESISTNANLTNIASWNEITGKELHTVGNARDRISERQEFTEWVSSLCCGLSIGKDLSDVEQARVRGAGVTRADHLGVFRGLRVTVGRRI